MDLGHARFLRAYYLYTICIICVKHCFLPEPGAGKNLLANTGRNPAKKHSAAASQTNAGIPGRSYPAALR